MPEPLSVKIVLTVSNYLFKKRFIVCGKEGDATQGPRRFIGLRVFFVSLEDGIARRK